ncbi:hypothetical protein LJC31_08260 [Synergistaceae bacterium OttesenSCG-928-I11]|nr:hypothetical protein [Synergistaceae bacterium OttesenSCG-928-I11]
MPRKKATTEEKEKLVGLTVRLPESESRIFNALLSLRGESANDVLKKTALEYIKKYKHLLNMNQILEMEKEKTNSKSPFAIFREKINDDDDNKEKEQPIIKIK